MTNEPVAWMQVHYKDNKPTKFSKVQTWEDDIPLYTHPVVLTDAEIAELSNKILCYQIYDNKESGVFEFARAILRKAQEK